MTNIEIYTDGGCRNNPGVGSWGFIVVADGVEVARSTGYSEMTTNNIMELTAVLEAERWLEVNYGEECEVTIYSDSQYVVNTMLVWYDGYMRSNKWMKKKNIELIRELMRLYDERQRRYKIVWVKGHADNRYNVMVDRLVNETMDSNQ